MGATEIRREILETTVSQNLSIVPALPDDSESRKPPVATKSSVPDCRGGSVRYQIATNSDREFPSLVKQSIMIDRLVTHFSNAAGPIH